MPSDDCSPGASRESSTSSLARSYGFCGAIHGAAIATTTMMASTIRPATAMRLAQNWRAKDTAIYLLTAVATRGSTTQHGVTSTNALIDVVQFFSDHVFQDLQAQEGSIHPILQVDAIRFLHTFRNQVGGRFGCALLGYAGG